MEDNNSDFLREQIKERPLNKRKLARRTIITVAMAVLFALVACLVFTGLMPFVNNMLYPEKQPEMITFPEEQEEIGPEDMLTDEAEEQERLENMGPSLEETEGIVDQQIHAWMDDLTLDAEDYKEMYSALSEVAAEAQRGVVTVTGVRSDIDWFDNVYQSKGKTSGAIVGNNGRELLIIAKKDISDKADAIVVTFSDRSQYMAEMKASDPGTGLAVYAVDLEKLSGSTLSSIRVAELGSSINTKLVSTPVIALGSPMGAPDSVGYGIITTASDVVSLPDISYKQFSTDIYGSQQASGVVINLRGQVLGIIDNSHNASDMRNMITAYGISDLKPIIEKMMNGIEIAHFGGYLSDVPQIAHEEQGMPYGAYIVRIEMNSPAMAVGIQSGDIITRFGDNPIENMTDLSKCILRIPAESQVELVVQRKGPEGYREMTIIMTLGTLQ